MARASSTLEAPSLPTGTELSERRYVYSGESSRHLPDQGSPRGNRPVKRRKRSPSNLIAIIVAASLIMVFYVWNKITVNRLVVEVDDLQTQYQKTLSANDQIRAEINRKANLERIGRVAGQLGLMNPKEQPVWFEVNADKLEQLGITP